MSEFRIEYTIQKSTGEDDEVEEIGFGSSGDSSGIDEALYDIDSDIQNRLWETEPGMPDPDDVEES